MGLDLWVNGDGDADERDGVGAWGLAGRSGRRRGGLLLGSKVIINIILSLNWKVEVPFN